MSYAFSCPRCGSTSHSRHDRLDGYCGRCRMRAGRAVDIPLDGDAALAVYAAMIGWVDRQGRVAVAMYNEAEELTGALPSLDPGVSPADVERFIREGTLSAGSGFSLTELERAFQGMSETGAALSRSMGMMTEVFSAGMPWAGDGLGQGQVLAQASYIPDREPPRRALAGLEPPAEDGYDPGTAARTMPSDYDDPERLFL